MATPRALIHQSLISGIVFLFCSSPTSSEPSVEETINYIDAKFGVCGTVIGTENYRADGSDISHVLETTTRIQLLESNRIVIEEDIWQWYLAKNLDGETTLDLMKDYNYTGEVDLQDLVTEVTIGDGGIRLVRISCMLPGCFDVQGKGTGEKNGETYDMLYERTESEKLLHVCSEDRERIVKALSHAIRIAGGKDELF